MRLIPGRRSRVVLLVGLVAACGWVGRASASQTSAPTPSVEERLNRVRAQIFQGTGHLEDTVPELKAILALDPASAEAHMLLAAAYLGLGSQAMTGEAKAELQQALDLDPALLPARLMLAQIDLAVGSDANARDEATIGLSQVPGQSQFLAVLGEAERRLGQPARSVQLNRQALNADPSLAQARYYLGLALLDVGQRDDAIREFEALVRSGTSVAEVYLSLGSAYLDAGRLDEAAGVLVLGTRLAPAQADLHVQLARAYRLKGSLIEAQQELTLATSAAEDVQPTPAYQRTATALEREWGQLRLRQGRFEAAADALRKALDMDPNDGPSHRALAEAYLRLGSLTQARAEAAAAARLGAPLAADLQRALDVRSPRPPAAKEHK